MNAGKEGLLKVKREKETRLYCVLWLHHQTTYSERLPRWQAIKDEHYNLSQHREWLAQHDQHLLGWYHKRLYDHCSVDKHDAFRLKASLGQLKMTENQIFGSHLKWRCKMALEREMSVKWVWIVPLNSRQIHSNTVHRASCTSFYTHSILKQATLHCKLQWIEWLHTFTMHCTFKYTSLFEVCIAATVVNSYYFG